MFTFGAALFIKKKKKRKFICECLTLSPLPGDMVVQWLGYWALDLSARGLGTGPFILLSLDMKCYQTSFLSPPWMKKSITEQLCPEMHTIDRLHKWWPKKHSFVFVLITPTSLVLKELFFCILSVLMRLVTLISIKRK